MTQAITSYHLFEQVLFEQTHLQLPSRPEWIEPTVEFLKQKAIQCGACSESRATYLHIALHEALTNSIVHGNLEVDSYLKEVDDDSFVRLLAERVADPAYADRRIDLRVHYDGRRCQWSITDQGRGFDVERVLAGTKDDSGELLASGRGILLMRSFMDDVRYEDGGRRVVLTLNQESGVERRANSRLAMHPRLRVAPIRNDGTIDWDAAYAAVARNVSREGIGLIQARIAEAGRVLIGIYSGDEPIYVPAEVRHCRALGGDLFELGCRFQPECALQVRPQPAPVPQEVAECIGRLLDNLPAAAPPAHDRRAHPRVTYTRRIDIYTDAAAPPLAGYARDLSRGGIAFLTTASLSGTVTVAFTGERGAAPRVRTRIVRCTRVQEGFYDVGGQFLSLDKDCV